MQRPGLDFLWQTVTFLVPTPWLQKEACTVTFPGRSLCIPQPQGLKCSAHLCCSLSHLLPSCLGGLNSPKASSPKSLPMESSTPWQYCDFSPIHMYCTSLVDLRHAQLHRCISLEDGSYRLCEYSGMWVKIDAFLQKPRQGLKQKLWTILLTVPLTSGEAELHSYSRNSCQCRNIIKQPHTHKYPHW